MIYLFIVDFFSSASPDPGYNQPSLLDDELSDIIDWDCLSDEGESESEVPTCSFIDWEAEEEKNDIPEPSTKKKRPYISNDSSDSSQ